MSMHFKNMIYDHPPTFSTRSLPKLPLSFSHSHDRVPIGAYILLSFSLLSQSLILLKHHSSIDMVYFPYHILKQNTKPITKIFFLFVFKFFSWTHLLLKERRKGKQKAKQYTEETDKETKNNAMKMLQGV